MKKDEITLINQINKKNKIVLTEEKIKGVSEKDKGYILIITEKPQAALKIAKALGKEEKKYIDNIPYYELERDGEKIIVASAAGHLFTLDEKEKKKDWPNFDITWKPSFNKKNSSWTKKYYAALKKLCKNAKEFIIATDYDIEGEVIGLNILRFIANRKDAKRMKFSTLTKEELENAYKNLMSNIDWPQAIAGETRHYLDWIYGINLSRALMNAIRSAGSFKIMSIGRVQGPALKLVVEKEKEIKQFKPTPYWQIYIIVSNKEKIKLKYEKDVIKKEEIEKFKSLKGEKINIETKIKEQSIKPPSPFDLTTLQLEAYKFYKITPTETLRISQNLYLAGLISYPRTSSQKIPSVINPKKIIEKLSSFYKETKFCIREKPIEGKKSDPAHPAIYPTGEKPQKLSKDELKIYDLIVRRFLSCFCEDAIIENRKIEGKIKNLKFIASGISLKKEGWLNVYKAKLQEKEIPVINEIMKIEEVIIEEKETQPPKRYTPASLVAELERRNLGTKATRALIVQTLYDRGYIKGKSIEATPLGISLIESLKEHSPIIIDENLTRKMEKEMEEIQKEDKKFNLSLIKKQEKILKEAEEVIKNISEKFKRNEKDIGRSLIEAKNKQIEEEIKDREIGECECKEGKLRIMFNKKSNRYFVACSAYPKCKITFTLPRGLIKTTNEKCKKCGWPILLVIKKGNKPKKFCFNPKCNKN